MDRPIAEAVQFWIIFGLMAGLISLALGAAAVHFITGRRE